eukprot:gene7559-2250_t
MLRRYRPQGAQASRAHARGCRLAALSRNPGTTKGAPLILFRESSGAKGRRHAVPIRVGAGVSRSPTRSWYPNQKCASKHNLERTVLKKRLPADGSAAGAANDAAGVDPFAPRAALTPPALPAAARVGADRAHL